MGLVYDEAIRAITQQQATLDGLRRSAATVLSAFALSTAFFAGLALEDQDPQEWAWAAIATFIVGVTISIIPLFPRNWIFRRSPKALIRDYVDHPDGISLVDMHRDLALHLESNFETNEVQLDKIHSLLRFSCVLLVVQMIFWLLEVIGR